MNLPHVVRHALAALAAICLLAGSAPSLAQPSANYIRRLNELETLVAQLGQSVSDLRASNTLMKSQIQDMATQLTAQNSRIDGLQTTIGKVSTDGQTFATTAASNALASAKTYSDNQLAPISDKVQHFSRSGNNVFITGANVYVRNGLGATVNNGYNGLGNLIVGYNELRGIPGSPDVRTGSHNLIVGAGANYSRNASIITGVNNASVNNYASVYGGTGNFANATYSVVVGGYNNQTNGGWSTILGGRDRAADAQLDHLP
jgi:hypothetical protein